MSTRTAEGAASEISRSLVRLYKECYGTGPARIRVTLIEDAVVCLVEGMLTAAERTLTANAQAGDVVSYRQLLQGAVRPRFVAAVEAALGRRVRSFMSTSDPGNELEVGVFVLEPRAGAPALDGAPVVERVVELSRVLG
jgi:uncharacterized protein YbcI